MSLPLAQALDLHGAEHLSQGPMSCAEAVGNHPTYENLDPFLLGKKRQDLMSKLQNDVGGQDLAVSEIARIVNAYQQGLRTKGKPAGSFLFVGSEGLGKVFTVETLSKILFNSSDRILRVDCAAYSAQMVQSPTGGFMVLPPKGLPSEIFPKSQLEKKGGPGYPARIILFENLERASPEFQLKIAKLASRGVWEQKGHEIDLSDSLIFYVSHISQKQIKGDLEKTQKVVGFAPGTNVPKGAEPLTYLKLFGYFQTVFGTDFMNSLNSFVVFNSFSIETSEKILNAQIADLKIKGVGVEVDDTARAFIRFASDAQNDGAKHLVNAFRNLIAMPIANLVDSGQINEGDQVKVIYSKIDGRLEFKKLKVENKL
jgi:ATP-dependent Clp protease ATP-binding subunit ClpA